MSAGGAADRYLGMSRFLLSNFALPVIGEADFSSQPRSHNDLIMSDVGWDRGWEVGGLKEAKIGTTNLFWIGISNDGNLGMGDWYPGFKCIGIKELRLNMERTCS